MSAMVHADGPVRVPWYTLGTVIEMKGSTIRGLEHVYGRAEGQLWERAGVRPAA